MASLMLTRNRGFLVNPVAPSSEPFRTLRLALQLGAEARSGRAVLFTSAEPEVGKSTVAANYALVSALSHSRTLVVDGDLRRPSLHRFFDVHRSPGVVELIAAESDLAKFAQSVPGLEHLDVLTAGQPIARPGDLASSQRMGELLRQACGAYDLVVIDSPPLLTGPDAAGLASHAGVDVVLVVKGNSKRRAVAKALRSLELIEANVLGFVVNRTGRLATYGY